MYCVKAAGLRVREKTRWCEVGEERAGAKRAGRSSREGDVMKRYLSSRKVALCLYSVTGETVV